MINPFNPQSGLAGGLFMFSFGALLLLLESVIPICLYLLLVLSMGIYSLHKGPPNGRR